ncbi:MAG: type II toxin-antitoxin system YafQ family toxin [Bacteroidales bacterium]|nr:type II toxin-antitoxin system YafQ family toxin [Bacteroidales bacterium]
MFSLESSTQFKKDYKALSASDAKLLEKALGILVKTGTLPYDPYLTHPLKGKFKGNLEAHIKPDMLLIWYEKVGNIIKLVRVGSHAKLFNQ